MDHYAYVVDELRRDDYRRLRAYVSNSDAQFPIWLVAVVRRLCMDHFRKKYGRFRAAGDHGSDSNPNIVSRRRLADLLMEEINPATMAADMEGYPDAELRRRELSDVLSDVVGCLPHRDRLLLKLRFQDDVPVRNIMAIMRFPSVFQVYRRLKVILADMAAALEQRGVDDAEP
jgi:RNA polymerase sigma factor (sigma-70 family)